MTYFAIIRFGSEDWPIWNFTCIYFISLKKYQFTNSLLQSFLRGSGSLIGYIQTQLHANEQVTSWFHGLFNLNQIEFWEWLKKSEIRIWNSFKYVVSSSYVYCNTNISWVTFEQPGLKCIPSLAWKSPRNPDKRFTTNVWILCWL